MPIPDYIDYHTHIYCSVSPMLILSFHLILNDIADADIEIIVIVP